MTETARLITGLAVVVSVAAGACGGTATKTALPTELLPASIEPARDEQQGQALRLRVYVGADHRARVVDWESELEQVLANSSALLQRGSGIRLELIESIVWERSGGPLANTLQALVSQDPGLDVDVVVGLVDAVADVSVGFEELVAVDSASRHIVVRSFHWQAEGAALGTAAEGLSEEARDRVLLRRRQHKQSILLTHGLAALFGESAAMGPRYEPGLVVLDDEAGGRLRNLVPQTLEARKIAAAVAPKPVTGALRRIDTENLAQVHMLLGAKKPDVAWEILEPLLELYPDLLEIVDAACLVSSARKASDATSHCTKAVALGTKTPTAHIALGGLLVASDPKLAGQHLMTGEALLDDGAAEWASLARRYKELSLATHALRAAAKSKEGSKVAEWANGMRSRYAVHVGVSADQEGDYLRALQAGLTLVYDRDFSKSAAAAKVIAKNFPASIALDLISCEVAMHQRNYPSALRSCESVLKRHPDNSWARYLQGVALARQKRAKDAMSLLQVAIAKDPTLEPAYKALSQLYRKSSDGRLAALRAAYKKHFGKTL